MNNNNNNDIALDHNNNSYNNKEKMIIIIHFNIFHVTCMSHNKQKLSMCDKNVARKTKLVAKKYRMFVCETRACHRTEHKNIVSLVAQKSYLSPKKTEIAFVRQKNCLMRDIKLSPKNTECMCDKSISPHNRQK